MEQILTTVSTLDGALDLAPATGSEFPEITWGDHFFHHAPDGLVPEREQPFATIVTKNYPGDTSCELDAPERWRLNIHVGRAAFIEITGEDPRAEGTARDLTATDALMPHPVYRAQGWVSIINPGERTLAQALHLLRAAHSDARRRALTRRRDRTGEA